MFSSMLSSIHLISRSKIFKMKNIANEKRIQYPSLVFTTNNWQSHRFFMASIIFGSYLGVKVCPQKSRLCHGPQQWFMTRLNIIIGIVQKVTRLLFCQNDSPMRGSFWQKESLIPHKLFELCLL